ncbi:MAG: TVP38/TMEM64 family protein [Alphaproteobacteria bacterium]|nr:TVP38/TMEM64 family protein [Alphaproteobacteria bacterium]
MARGGQDAVTRDDAGDASKTAKADGPESTGSFFTLRRLWPLVVIGAGIAAFFALGLESYFTFDTLKQNREWLLNQVSQHTLLTVLAFIGIYALIVAFSLPGATVMTIAGGFLFGQWLGTAWNVIGATIGATLLFLAARTALGDVLERRAGPWLQRLEAGFQKNALSYLLFMRLVPAFPFFVVNLVPAFLGVRLRTFVGATFFGIIPGGFVYTSFGAGLGSVFDSGEDFSVSGVLTPEVITAMVGLGVLALIPVAVRTWQARRR